MEESERIDQIEERIAKLEAVVFPVELRGVKTVGQKSTSPKASGPSAGVRILIERRFFESKRGLGDVRSALGELGYHYSAQAIDMALKRMSRRNGALVLVREKRRNYYAERK